MSPDQLEKRRAAAREQQRRRRADPARNARTNALRRARYQQSKEYREKRKEAARSYYQEHAPIQIKKRTFRKQRDALKNWTFATQIGHPETLPFENVEYRDGMDWHDRWLESLDDPEQAIW